MPAHPCLNRTLQPLEYQGTTSYALFWEIPPTQSVGKRPSRRVAAFVVHSEHRKTLVFVVFPGCVPPVKTAWVEPPALYNLAAVAVSLEVAERFAAHWASEEQQKREDCETALR
jgi:hypothetical protein